MVRFLGRSLLPERVECHPEKPLPYLGWRLFFVFGAQFGHGEFRDLKCPSRSKVRLDLSKAIGRALIGGISGCGNPSYRKQPTPDSDRERAR